MAGFEVSNRWRLACDFHSLKRSSICHLGPIELPHVLDAEVIAVEVGVQHGELLWPTATSTVEHDQAPSPCLRASAPLNLKVDVVSRQS